MNNLPHTAQPATPQGMTRTQQTFTIVGALVAIAAFFAFVFWPAPNLDGLSPYERCAYSSYYKNRGGSQAACEQIEGDAATARLMRGY